MVADQQFENRSFWREQVVAKPMAHTMATTIAQPPFTPAEPVTEIPHSVSAPDTYRLVLVLPQSRRLLVIAHTGTPRLPRITIPGHSRVAEHLTRGIEENWKVKSTVIDYLTDESISIPGVVVELRAQDEVLRSNGFLSIDVDAVAETDLTADERIRLEGILSCNPGERGPFSRLGWIDDVLAWTESSVSDRNWKLTGQFRQFNASPFFSLIRFEASGPALWFKAVGEPNLREFPISVALARLFPNYVPTLVATHPSWNAWLTIEGEGSHPDESSEIALWERAVTTLAHLQIASAEKTEELLEVGCRDLRMPVLLDFVDPFLGLVEALMKKQSKVPPTMLGRQELRDLGAEIKNACLRLSELGLPDTLGHLDFNPSNILVSVDSCVFLDWAEACVSHPFLTFEYLLEQFRRSHREDASLASRLISVYSESWKSLASPRRICEALNLTPLLAVFAYAVGNDAWRDLTRLQDAKLAGYFRALTRRMHREAALLEQRREACLS